mgnify:CR=1 FL=1
MNIVKAINIYPIKGMQGQSLDSATIQERGIKNDRRYMLVDSEGTFLSQRSHRKLCRFYPRIDGSEMKVTFQGNQINFSLDKEMEEVIAARVFEHDVTGHEVSAEVSQWFSDQLEAQVRLIKMTKEDTRYKKLIKGPDQTEVSYADGYPYLIIGTASLQEINSRLKQEIGMERFRPNIVVDTDVPHEEDQWGTISIGEASMMIIKPCSRCGVITIDQQSGVRGREPLATLSKYRRSDKSIFFGANAIRLSGDKIHVGDSLRAN